MSTIPHIGNDEKIQLSAGFAVIDRHENPDFVNMAKVDLAARYVEARHEGLSHDAALVRLGHLLADNGWYPGSSWPDGWPTDSAPGPVDPPPVPTSPLARVEIENERYFKAGGKRFEWREKSAFTLLARLILDGAEGTAYVRQWVRRRRAEGFTVTRVMMTLGGGYWTNPPIPDSRSFETNPSDPRYWPAVDLLCQIHEQEGVYIRPVFLCALEPFGGVWYPDRRDVFEGEVRRKAEEFTVECARRLADRVVVAGAELCNEPTEIGMRRAWDNGALVALGRRVKAVAPKMLLCGGESNDGNGLIDPFDWADAHLARNMEVHGWAGPKRMGEVFAVDQEGRDPNNDRHDPHLFPPSHLYAMQRIKRMPFVAGENVNMGERRADGHTGDVENQPNVCFGIAAISRARRMAGVCFHDDGGLWTTEPKEETPACIAAWHRGLDIFPMSMDGMWRGHWGQAAGDYWRDIWPAEDDERVVERRIAEGGAWRVFGCGRMCVVFPHLKTWDYTRYVEAPHTQLAFEKEGFYGVSVYRRN